MESILIDYPAHGSICLPTTVVAALCKLLAARNDLWSYENNRVIVNVITSGRVENWLAACA